MRHPPLAIALFFAGCAGPEVPLGEADESSSGAAVDGGDDSPTASASMSGAADADAGGDDDDDDDDDNADDDDADDDDDDDDDDDAGTAGEESGGEESGESGGTIDPPKDATVVFVNFDGPTLTGGTDDSTNDVTQIGEMTGDLEPYGEGPIRDEIVEHAQSLFAGLNVVVTGERPDDGDYIMAVVTPSNPFGGAPQGVSPIDCEDSNPRNIVFLFFSLGDGFSAEHIGSTVARQSAFTIGLEHVDAREDLLNGFILEGTSFTDECHDVVNGPVCPEQHAEHCPAGQQNSFAELEAILGPA